MKKPAESPLSPALSPGLRRYLLFTAAVAGAAVMIVEILGAKMLAPYVGTSHFVWTAQIGVTLVALAIGYASGGWLADRSPRLRWLYGALLLAAVGLGWSVLGCEPVAFACLRFKLAVGSLLAAAILFLPPLVMLATVPPFLVRALTTSVARVGTSMGRLSAISTGGSVVGTCLVGYVLIPLLPNSMILYVTAGALALLALGYFAIWERRQVVPALLLAALAAGVGFVGVVQTTLEGPGGARELYRGNSNFGLLQVVEWEDGGQRYYLNDLLTQNTYLPRTHQSASLFTYALHGLARAYTPAIQDVLCLGMGAGIVPMLFAHEGATVDLVEINPAAVPVAERYFDFDRTKVNLTLGDARQFVAGTRKQYDTIVLDAFLGESPPSHLMTREALASLKTHLKPGGTIVMNSFGEFTPGRDFVLASLDQTLQAVFRSVRIHATGNGNVFFVAADREHLEFVHPPEIDTAPEFLRSRVEAAFQGLKTTDPAHGRVLTDDFNPVDYYDAANREELRKRLALASRRD